MYYCKSKMSPCFEPDALHHGFVEDSKDNPCWLQEINWGDSLRGNDIRTLRCIFSFKSNVSSNSFIKICRIAIHISTETIKRTILVLKWWYTEIRCNRHTFGLIKISEDSQYIWNIPYPRVHDLDEKYVCLVYKDVRGEVNNLRGKVNLLYFTFIQA